MTSPSAGADYGPQSLLADSRRLAQQVRRAQRATWFPLLVCAAVTLAAIPVYGFGARALTCRSGPAVPFGGRVCAVYVPAAFVYWPIALVLAYLVIAAFYLRRARARGLGTRVRPFVVAGIVLALLLTLAAIWAAQHPPVGNGSLLGVRLGPEQYALFNRLVSGASAIGLALLVLARVERSRALLAVAIVYLAVVLLPIPAPGLIMSHPSPWQFLPRLLTDAGILLITGLGFAVAQRRSRRDPE
jgi:hypothetical protein